MSSIRDQWSHLRHGVELNYMGGSVLCTTYISDAVVVKHPHVGTVRCQVTFLAAVRLCCAVSFQQPSGPGATPHSGLCLGAVPKRVQPPD